MLLASVLVAWRKAATAGLGNFDNSIRFLATQYGKTSRNENQATMYRWTGDSGSTRGYGTWASWREHRSVRHAI